MDLRTILNDTQDIINDFINEVIHKYTFGYLLDNIGDLIEFLTNFNNSEIDEITNALERQQAVKTMLGTLKMVYEKSNNKSNNKSDEGNKVDFD